MKLLFKYTSRSRVDRFFEGLDSIINNIADKENYIVLCSFDIDDTAYANKEFLSKVQSYEKVIVYYGTSESKIFAINRDMVFAPHYDILVNFSDDIVITQYGFDNIIREEMMYNYPSMDGVLHFKDKNNGDKLMTMSIMGKRYYDKFNYIYHPDYISLWSDNEAQQVAKILGKYTFVDKLIYEHKHPAYNLAPMDEQYKLTESFYHIDGETFKKREANNFYL